MATLDRWFLKQTSRVAGSNESSTSARGCTSIDHKSFGEDEQTNEKQSVDDVATSTVSRSRSEEDSESSDEEEPSTQAISSSSNDENSDGERSLPASKRYKGSSIQDDEVARSTRHEPKDKFRSKWLSEFPWLKYDSARGLMYCSSCRRHKKKNAYTQTAYTEGTTNFKKTNILRHSQTRDHKSCLEAEGCRSLTAITAEAHGQKMKAIVSAMRNVYWLAKEEVATLNYESLNKLLQLQDCPDIAHLSCKLNAQYTSYHIAEEMQEAISSCLFEELIDSMANANFFGILIDESTDISTSKNLIMYVRIAGDRGVSTHYLKMIVLDERATGQAITDKVLEALKDSGIPKQKCVGFASDGARAMIGKKNGAAAILRRECPGMVAVHCIAHRLALASSQAAKAFPELGRYKRTLIAIYSYFSHSALRVNTLQEVQKILDDPILHYKPLYEIRWLSFFSAVSAVKRTLKSLVTYFEQEYAENNDPIAKGLVTWVSSYKFFAITHLLYDVLSELTRLSKIFQKESLDFSAITPSVNAAVASITAMGSHPGPALAEFMEQVERNNDALYGHMLKMSPSDPLQFKKLQELFLEAVVENLQARFPQTSVISAMSILDPGNLPKNKAELPTYGNCQLDVLIDHFSDCPMITSECKEEWPCLKQLAAMNYSTLSMQQFWILISKHNKEQFPHLIQLAHACMAIPVTSATCERGFSTQNRIKTKLRNRMKTKRLDVLMRISEEGPPIDNYDFSRSAKKWIEMKERRLFKPSKK